MLVFVSKENAIYSNRRQWRIISIPADKHEQYHTSFNEFRSFYLTFFGCALRLATQKNHSKFEQNLYELDKGK